MGCPAASSEQTAFSPDEWRTRVELAAFYRAMQKFGLTDLIYNHITAKIPGTEHFLLNVYGLHYSEVTASNLYKIDIDGTVVYTPLGYEAYALNSGGYTIHTAVHAARPDVGCVVHTHSRAGLAIAATDQELLPLTQDAMNLYGQVSYHEYGMPGLPEEGAAMVRSLGANNYMVLRNHGLLVCGPTIASAFVRTYWIEQACKTQMDLMQAKLPPRPINDDLARRMAAMFAGRDGELEWAAVRRVLDREDPSYAT